MPQPDPAVMSQHLRHTWFTYIDQLQGHMESASPPWVVDPSSSIAKDDELTAPFQLSHQIQRLVFIAIDHLTAVRRLMGGDPNATGDVQGVLNVNADYTLMRGALEAAMVAHWLLLPADRITRIRRCLSLLSQDFFDEYQAAKRLSEVDGVGGPKVLADAEQRREGRRKWIRQTAERAEVTGNIPIFKLVTALTDVDAASDRNLLIMWKLTSGMAHGRLWAGLTLNTMTETFDHGDDTVTIRSEGDLTRVTVALGDAVSALQSLLRLFELRRTVPGCH